VRSWWPGSLVRTWVQVREWPCDYPVQGPLPEEDDGSSGGVNGG